MLPDQYLQKESWQGYTCQQTGNLPEPDYAWWGCDIEELKINADLPAKHRKEWTETGKQGLKLVDKFKGEGKRYDNMAEELSFFNSAILQKSKWDLACCLHETERASNTHDEDQGVEKPGRMRIDFQGLHKVAVFNATEQLCTQNYRHKYGGHLFGL